MAGSAAKNHNKCRGGNGIEARDAARRGVEIPRSPSAFTNLPVDLEVVRRSRNACSVHPALFSMRLVTISETWESPASLLLSNLQRKGFILWIASLGFFLRLEFPLMLSALMVFVPFVMQS